MKLVVFPGVLRPPSDAWMLAHELRDSGLAAGADVLDLCSGSGVLGIVAARAGARSVTAADISQRALVNARVNAALNRSSLALRRGDLFDAVGRRRFDLIVTNPPYLPGQAPAGAGRRLAIAIDAGPDGRRFLDRICAGAPAHLRPGGSMLLVQSSLSDPDRSLELLDQAGLAVEVRARRRGPLGPLMRARAESCGLSLADEEELVVVKASSE
jgi:release factor glutamine methyltransferase